MKDRLASYLASIDALRGFGKACFHCLGLKLWRMWGRLAINNMKCDNARARLSLWRLSGRPRVKSFGNWLLTCPGRFLQFARGRPRVSRVVRVSERCGTEVYSFGKCPVGPVF